VKFIVPGRPVPLKRPRFGLGRVYDDQVAIKKIYADSIRYQYLRGPLQEGPLELKITFYFKRPRKKKKDRYHSCRPDLSNLVKFIEDVAIGVLYKDDDCIAKIIAEKKYGDIEKTEIELNQLDNTMQDEPSL